MDWKEESGGREPRRSGKQLSRNGQQLPWGILPLAALAPFVLLIGACGSGEAPEPSDPATTPPPPPKSENSGEAASESGPVSPSPSPALVKKMRSIVIPKVEFVNTPLEDALNFLVSRSQELDPEGKGINVILKDQELGSRQVTLKMSQVPLSEVIRYVVTLADGQITVDEHAVVIDQRKAGTSPMAGVAALIDPKAIAAQRKKLTELVVPSIEFVDTPLTDALAFLQERSFELDVDSPEEQRGINLVLSVPETSGIAIEDLRVTLNLKDIPLGEVLKYAAGLTGLEYHVEGDAVVISAPDSPETGQ